MVQYEIICNKATQAENPQRSAWRHGSESMGALEQGRRGRKEDGKWTQEYWNEDEEDGIRLVGLGGQKLGHGSLKLIILFSNFSIFFVNSRFTCHTSLLYFPPHFSHLSVVS